MLTLGMALMFFGLQAFLDSDRRAVSTEVIKATFQMIAGIFLVWFWYISVRASSNKGNNLGR
jgi:uncharacterized membrane protein